MRAAVVGMMLVALLAFASDRSFGQQQPRRGLDNLLGDTQEIAGPAQAVVPEEGQEQREEASGHGDRSGKFTSKPAHARLGLGG